MPPKTKIVDPNKLPRGAPFTPELARQREIQVQQGARVNDYGFRIRLLSDATGDARLIQAAEQYVDDTHAADGVRGERPMEAVQGGGSPGGYTQSQIDARTRWRLAEEAVGWDRTVVLRHSLIDCLNAINLAKKLRVTNKTAVTRVVAALEALADYYERPVRRSHNTPKKSDWTNSQFRGNSR